MLHNLFPMKIMAIGVTQLAASGCSLSNTSHNQWDEKNCSFFMSCNNNHSQVGETLKKISIATQHFTWEIFNRLDIYTNSIRTPAISNSSSVCMHEQAKRIQPQIQQRSRRMWRLLLRRVPYPKLGQVSEAPGHQGTIDPLRSVYSCQRILRCRVILVAQLSLNSFPSPISGNLFLLLNLCIS